MGGKDRQERHGEQQKESGCLHQWRDKVLGKGIDTKKASGLRFFFGRCWLSTHELGVLARDIRHSAGVGAGSVCFLPRRMGNGKIPAILKSGQL